MKQTLAMWLQFKGCLIYLAENKALLLKKMDLDVTADTAAAPAAAEPPPTPPAAAAPAEVTAATETKRQKRAIGYECAVEGAW